MINEILKITLKKEEAYLYDFVNNSQPTITTKIPTLAVNKNNKLFINPKFVKTLKNDELIGALYHEALHIIFKHTISKGEPYLINIAGDIYINELLKDAGIKLPKKVLFKKTYSVPQHLTTCQEIYDWLEQNLPKKVNINLQKSYEKEQKEINKNQTEKIEIEDIAKEIYDEIVKKYKKKNHKNIDGSLKWDIDLTSEIGRLIKRVEQKNYLRPPRREVKGLILPRQITNIKRPLIHMYIDVSGSMEETLPIVINSLLKIKSKLKEYKARYFGFNTDIFEVKEEELKDLYAGGGTEFKEVIKGADLHIIITDGELDFGFIDNRKDIVVYLCGGKEIVKRK